jgi:N-acetylglucosaminyldiphosphoundecaprenol N-acetyl-beta-D-mannosaminyltransferase
MEVNVIQEFGLNICPLPLTELVDFLDVSISKNQIPIIISGLNAYAIVQSKSDKIYHDYLVNSSVVNIDGISVVLALRFLGYPIKERVSCPDLFYELINLALKQKYSIYLIGSKPEIISEAASNLQTRYPELQIVGFETGYYDSNKEKEIVADIKAKKPKMLFLGMPSPKKEAFAFKYAKELNIPLTLGVGGLFDIEAGLIKRAPFQFQRLGMEWFYRFLQEPARMWRRYLIGNFKFIMLVVKEKFRGRGIRQDKLGKQKDLSQRS